ncbi:MAG: Verru_Chthon cassette protein C [bacterium]
MSFHRTALFTVARVGNRKGTVFSRKSPGIPVPFRRVATGFTLIELLVSMAVLSMIMLLLFGTISSSSTLWTRTTGKVQAFQAARAAFESMTRNLSQATLQNYYGYADSEGNPVPLINPSFKLSSGSTARAKVPTKYLRASELHFVCGPAASLLTQAGITGLDNTTSGDAVFFQAPIGFSDGSYQTQPSMLNVCGYYVQFTKDDSASGGTGAIPDFASSLPATYRYRLMEVIQPADKNGIYTSTDQDVDADGLPTFSYDLNWVKKLDLANRTNRHVLGDNIILLVLLPKLAPEDEKLYGGTGDGNLIAPHYTYDSRSWETGYSGAGITATANKILLEKVIMNRLPPLVEVIMVAIDDRSAVRLIGTSSTPPADLQKKLYGSGGTRFTDATKLKADLADLENDMNSLGLNYRIFHTEVRLPGASYGE